MFNLLFILSMNGCMSNKKQLEMAKTKVIGQCIDEIELLLHKNGCPNIQYFRGQQQVVFRCDKPDRMRKNLWDTWWFRLTSSGLVWPEDKLPEVKEHTICIDGRFRLEAYPPEKE